jgi:ankyrin repeat protein
LIIAAKEGNVEVVELLLNKGANIEATDEVINNSEHSKCMHKNNIPKYICMYIHGGVVMFTLISSFTFYNLSYFIVYMNLIGVYYFNVVLHFKGWKNCYKYGSSEWFH